MKIGFDRQRISNDQVHNLLEHLQQLLIVMLDYPQELISTFAFINIE